MALSLSAFAQAHAAAAAVNISCTPDKAGVKRELLDTVRARKVAWSHHEVTRDIARDNARWWRGTVVERRSLAGELSLSCARPAADG